MYVHCTAETNNIVRPLYPNLKKYVCGTADYPAHMTPAFLGLFVLLFSHPSPPPPPRRPTPK